MSESDAARFWDERFENKEYIFGVKPNEFLKSQRSLFGREAKVLAVADGEARNGVWLAECGCDVTSLDISSVAQRKAKSLARARQVTLDFVLADALLWNYPLDTYDCVVCIFIQFSDPSERKALFSNIERTLKKGGRLVLQGYGLDQLSYQSGGPGKRENLYSVPLLQDLLRDWQMELIEEYESVLDEGPKHQGMASLISVVARKK
jgi:SAM-dependent methyltransferase